MKCPVCGKEGLSESQNTCPQCAADLSILVKIKELPLFYYSKAVDGYKVADIEDAIKNLHSAVSLEPDFLEAYLLLAKIYMEKEDLAVASMYLQKAKKLLGPDTAPEVKEEEEEEEEVIKLMKKLKSRMSSRLATYVLMAALAVAIIFALVNIFQLKESSSLFSKKLESVNGVQGKILQELNLLNGAIEKERVKSVNVSDILPAYIKKAKEQLKALNIRKKDLEIRLSHYDINSHKYAVVTGKINKINRDIEHYQQIISPYASFFKQGE